MDCIFCKIANGEIKSDKVYDDGTVIGFKDIHPICKTHILFIHKNHTRDVNEMIDGSNDEITSIFSAISKYTKESGLVRSGFRVVTNVGSDGGQEVFHIHFHLLGGEKLRFSK